MNFPKPEINRSSPDSKVLFMISRKDSTMDVDSLFGSSDFLQIDSTNLVLVMVTCYAPWMVLGEILE